METLPNDTRTENDAVRAIVETYIKPMLLSGVSQPAPGAPAPVLLAPVGMRAVDISPFLDQYLERPRRIEGTAKVTTLESFIDLTMRFETVNSAIFANDDRAAPTLTAVLNYNQPSTKFGEADGKQAGPTPEFGDHRVHYAFPLSDEWKAWQAANGRPMNMTEFAEFLEERIVDVLADGVESASEAVKQFLALTNAHIAGPSALLNLSAGLKVQQSVGVVNSIRLDSGEAEVAFKSENLDEFGAKLRIPNVFLIGVPVFRNGGRYQLVARLRHRVAGGTVTFWYDLWRADLAFTDAFVADCKQASEATELPLFYGKPE